MSGLLSLGPFRIDLHRQCLLGSDGPIPLRRKSFDLLRYLAEHPGRILSKEELLRAVWVDVVVGDDSLAKCISEVRLALGDAGREMLKTIPRRGYCMELTTSAGPAPDSKPSIAVLPFANTDGGPEERYLSDGITDDIITELTRFSDLMVIASNSSFRFRDRAVDIRRAGRDLGARYILEGSIRQEKKRFRISCQLVEVETGTHLWAERFDGPLTEVFAVQDEVARTVATLLSVHVSKAESRRTLLKPPATWLAYDHYLRGVEALWAYWASAKAEDLYQSRRHLEQSLSLDPGYARACADLARTFGTAYVNPVDADYLKPEVFAHALTLARRAVRLDPNLPHARAQLGMLYCWNRQHDEAIAEFERARGLNQNYINARYMAVLLYAGEHRRAIDEAKRYMRLDPFYLPITPRWMGVAHYMLKEYQEALPPLREAALRLPNFQGAHSTLAATYAQLGEMGKAAAEAAEVLRINPQFTINGTGATNVFRRRVDREHLVDGMKKAGLPEC